MEFLILNPQFPKSLAYSADELLEAFKMLPKAKKYLTSYEEPIFKAHTLLRLTSLESLTSLSEDESVFTALDTLLAHLSELFSTASTELSKTYFSHYDE